jgi:hypothetical protein
MILQKLGKATAKKIPKIRRSTTVKVTRSGPNKKMQDALKGKPTNQQGPYEYGQKRQKKDGVPK